MAFLPYTLLQAHYTPTWLMHDTDKNGFYYHGAHHGCTARLQWHHTLPTMGRGRGGGVCFNHTHILVVTLALGKITIFPVTPDTAVFWQKTKQTRTKKKKDTQRGRREGATQNKRKENKNK